MVMNPKRAWIWTLALAIIVVGLIASGILLLSPAPTIQVTQCSLSSDNIPNSGVTTITSTTKNNDKNSSHQIMIQFLIQPAELLNFYGGTPSTVVQSNSTMWEITYIQNPSSTYQEQLNVQGFLASGYTSVGYTIKVIFIVDGKQLIEKTLNLSVHQ